MKDCDYNFAWTIQKWSAWPERSCTPERYMMPPYLHPANNRCRYFLSNLHMIPTSEQTSYRLLRLFSKVRAHAFCCSSFPNQNRLRWVAIWLRVSPWSLRHLYCCDVPRRSKVRFAPTSFYAHGKKDVIRLLPCFAFPNRTRVRWASIGFFTWQVL